MRPAFLTAALLGALFAACAGPAPADPSPAPSGPPAPVVAEGLVIDTPVPPVGAGWRPSPAGYDVLAFVEVRNTRADQAARVRVRVTVEGVGEWESEGILWPGASWRPLVTVPTAGRSAQALRAARITPLLLATHWLDASAARPDQSNASGQPRFGYGAADEDCTIEAGTRMGCRFGNPNRFPIRLRPVAVLLAYGAEGDVAIDRLVGREALEIPPGGSLFLPLDRELEGTVRAYLVSGQLARDGAGATDPTSGGVHLDAELDPEQPALR